MASKESLLNVREENFLRNKDIIFLLLSFE